MNSYLPLFRMVIIYSLVVADPRSYKVHSLQCICSAHYHTPPTGPYIVLCCSMLRGHSCLAPPSCMMGLVIMGHILSTALTRHACHENRWHASVALLYSKCLRLSQLLTPNASHSDPNGSVSRVASVEKVLRTAFS